MANREREIQLKFRVTPEERELIMTFFPEEDCFTYPCPCGDKFTFYVVVF